MSEKCWNALSDTLAFYRSATECRTSAVAELLDLVSADLLCTQSELMRYDAGCSYPDNNLSVAQRWANHNFFVGPTLAANDVPTIKLWLAHYWARNKLLPGKGSPGAKRRQFASAFPALTPLDFCWHGFSLFRPWFTPKFWLHQLAFRNANW